MGSIENRIVEDHPESHGASLLPIGFEECELNDVLGSVREVYEGEFSLQDGSVIIQLRGRIFVRWGIDSHLRISADIVSLPQGVDLLKYLWEDVSLAVVCNGRNLGRVGIREIDNDQTIKGVFCDLVPESDLDVKSLSFSLLNTRNIANRCIRPFGKKGVNWSMCELDNGVYLIKIQHHSKFKEIRSTLSNDGGCAVTHYGELVKKQGAMTPQESEDIIKCLNFFLSFVNGRKTGIVDIFKHKIDGSVWRDPLGHQNDPYKTVRSWFPVPVKIREDFLNDLWKDFYRAWFVEDESENIRQLIQLYVESNVNLIYIENCLILSQTALELYSNWKFANKANKGAALKIRTILSESLKVSGDIPVVLNELLKFKKISFQDSKGVVHQKNDGPDCIVEIRNSIVHPERWRKDNLKKISISMRIETWLLANWYIELCILKAVSYEGVYKNRLHIDKELVEKVPWVES